MAGRPLELALLLLLATLWAASYGFIAIALEGFPPLTLIAARCVIAGGLLMALLPLRGLALPRGAGLWGQCAAQAGVATVLPFLLIAWGQQSVPSALAVVLGATAPIFAYLLGLVLGRREAGGWRKLAGITIGLVGVVLVMGPAALEAPAGVLPMLAILGSAACFGAGAHIAGRLTGIDPMVPAAASLLCGAVALVPLALLLDRPWALAPGRDAVLALLALSLLSTALAVLIYFRLLRTLGILATTAQAYLRVPIGAAIGVLLLGESLPPTAWAGIALVAAGVAAMTMPPRRSLGG
jgi:drug/metabolite transporter (DMT)-like permease